MLLDLADFAWLEQPISNLMVVIFRAWYNGSYTMAGKPMKFLESHYTVIQFLIIIYAVQRGGSVQSYKDLLSSSNTGIPWCTVHFKQKSIFQTEEDRSYHFLCKY